MINSAIQYIEKVPPNKQKEMLVKWSELNEKYISDFTWTDKLQKIGDYEHWEHDIWRDGEIVTKITRPDIFDKYLPLRYLRRLLLCNTVFKDDIRLIGIGEDCRIVTSQPWRGTERADEQEVDDYL